MTKQSIDGIVWEDASMYHSILTQARTHFETSNTVFYYGEYAIVPCLDTFYLYISMSTGTFLYLQYELSTKQANIEWIRSTLLNNLLPPIAEDNENESISSIENIENIDNERIENVEIERIENVEIKRIENVENENIENVEIKRIENIENIENVEIKRIENIENIENVENIENERIENIENERIENIENVENIENE